MALSPTPWKRPLVGLVRSLTAEVQQLVSLALWRGVAQALLDDEVADRRANERVFGLPFLRPNDTTWSSAG